MRTIETTITINATPAAVWEVLTDFSAYPNWNPFIQRITGELIPEAPLEVEMCLPGQSPMVMQPRVVQHEAGRSFSWLGHLWRPGLFDGRHTFELASVGPRQTQLIHREEFRGVLVRPLLWLIGRKTKQGFVAMNEALAARVEERASKAS